MTLERERKPLIHLARASCSRWASVDLIYCGCTRECVEGSVQLVLYKNQARHNGTYGLGVAHEECLTFSVLSSYTEADHIPPIYQFCTANLMLFTLAASSTEPTQQGDIQALCGSTPTLKAELMWTLKRISDHHSYTSNENISKLFKVMFSTTQRSRLLSHVGATRLPILPSLVWPLSSPNN